MFRSIRTATAAVTVALAATFVPIGGSPAAAEDPTADLSVSVNAPTSPVRVGDLTSVTLVPQIDPSDTIVDYTITYEVPANFEVYDTMNSGFGDVTCPVLGHTVTCSYWYPMSFTIGLVAVAPGTTSHVATIDAPIDDPTPDPTPNTGTATTTVVASEKDLTVAPTMTPFGTVGEPLDLVLTVTDEPRPSTDPRWTVDGTITWDIPDELTVVSAELVPPFNSDEMSGEVTGPHFDRGSCSVDGQEVVCSGLRYWFPQGGAMAIVRVVPAAAGTWPIGATFTPGPHQSEPDPDPRPNTATWSALIDPAQDGVFTGVVSTGAAPIAGVDVAAYELSSPTPAAVATTSATGAFSLTGLTPGSYEILYTPPTGSPYLPQWRRADGVASGRATATPLTVTGTGQTVDASRSLEDLDLTRVDLGAGVRSFEDTDQVLYEGDEGEIVLEPRSRTRRVDGQGPTHPATTRYEVTVPNDVTVVSAFPRWGAGDPGDPVSTCSVTAHEVDCTLVAGVPEVVVNVVPTSAGPFDLIASHTSTTPETIPQVLANTAAISIDVAPNIGGISGTLLAPGSADPVADAWVLAYRDGDGLLPSSGAAWAVSGIDGTFHFEGLPSGDYKVYVAPPAASGLASQWLDQRPTRATATVFPVRPWNGTDTGHHTLAARGITGTVTDGTSPVAGATVRAFAAGSLWVPAATTTTDATGAYRFPTLGTGDYHVVVTPAPGSGRSARWYADSPTRAGATTVPVPAIGAVTGIDVTLPAGATIAGTVTGPSGAVADARVIAFAPGDGYVGSKQTRTAIDGTYTLPDVVDGSYKLLIVAPTGSGLADEWFDDASTRSTATPIVVSGGPHTGIDIALAPS